MGCRDEGCENPSCTAVHTTRKPAPRDPKERMWWCQVCQGKLGMAVERRLRHEDLSTCVQTLAIERSALRAQVDRQDHFLRKVVDLLRHEGYDIGVMP